MSDTSLKWHEIITGADDADALAFVDLYREYAEAVRQQAAARDAAFWPFPRG